jgi:hypothetical protein
MDRAAATLYRSGSRPSYDAEPTADRSRAPSRVRPARPVHDGSYPRPW